jgi:hypothetical protein
MNDKTVDPGVPTPFDPLFIWEDVEKTDHTYTKAFSVGGYSGTSANPTWLYKQATRVFGPAGIGWGYEVLEQEFVDGSPMVWNKEPIGVNEKIHTVRVRLWYKVSPADLPPHLRKKRPNVLVGGPLIDDDVTDGHVFGTGHTPYMYLTNKGTVYTDKEYEKKSITDAVTKALALLGFGGDIRMGMYEMADYVNQIKDESAIEHALDAGAEKLAQLTEFTEWLDKNMKLMETALSLRELEFIYKPGLVRVTRQGSKDQVLAFEEMKNTSARRLLDEAAAKKAAQQAEVKS